MTNDLRSEKKKNQQVTCTKQQQTNSFKRRVLKYELETTGIICLCVLVAYYLGYPKAMKCLSISYHVGQGQYDKGIDDYHFVAFWVVAFTFLRATAMRFFFHPIAKSVGIKPFSKRERFAEQGWSFSYYSVFWTLGMYIMYHSPHWFNTSQYWIDYPHILISKQTKVYYLMQLAFWIQQVYTIHIEKRRKDHFAMVTHHFITILLIASSYYTNFTRIGNAVLCCMDLSDIILSLAKVLKYLGLSLTCDITFGLFALSWPITRHILFSIIIWATAVEPATYLDMKWEPEKGKYFTPITQKIYIFLFVMLNIIMFYWFAMIVKVIVRVLKGKNAEDTRSDEEEDEQESNHVDTKPVENYKTRN